MSIRIRIMVPWLVGGVLVLGSLGVAGAAWAAGTSCSPAGATGLTSAVVATSGQTITGVIDATGCDVGVYVGPGVTGVVIRDATITGANDHGVLVQNTSDVTIEDNLVTGNGVASHACPPPPAQPKGPCIAEDKAIELVGTSGVEVIGNVVTGNLADGGIGLADDGSIDPGALAPGSPHISYRNVVEQNVVSDNRNGCGIVAAGYNAGEVVADNEILQNLVTGNPAGIVVAADTPHTAAVNNKVIGNIVTGNFLPGVIVHSNAPGDVVTGTYVADNTIIGNGPDPSAAGGHGPARPTGAVAIAEPLPPGAPPSLVGAKVMGTAFLDNTFVDEVYTIWTSGALGTRSAGNR